VAAAQRKRAGYAMVAAAACGWGTWPVILRRAPMAAALQSAILLTVLTLASAIPVYLLGDRVRGVRANWRQWLAVGWLGIADSLNVVLFFEAYQRTSVAIAVLTHYLAPIFVALFAPMVLGEKLRARTIAAVAIAFAGLVLLLGPWRTELSFMDVTGAAFGAGSAVFYASNVLVNKKLAPVFSASEMMFFHGFVAVPFLWLLVPKGAWAATSTTALVVVTLGALGPGALGGLTFVWGLRRIDASHASILALLEPLIAVVLSVLTLGQRITAISVVGGVLILIGAVFVVFTGQSKQAEME
jgi:drug/metabolite transporter (DMT)-like permease